MAPTNPGATCLTKVEDRLIDGAANSAAFQSLVNVTTAAAAKERIHVDAVRAKSQIGETKLRSELQADLPLMLVFMAEDDEFGYQFEASGDGLGQFMPRGTVSFLLQRVDPLDSKDEQDRMRAWKDVTTAIVEQILDYAGGPPIRSVMVKGKWTFGTLDEARSLGDIQAVEFVVTWAQGAIS